MKGRAKSLPVIRRKKCSVREEPISVQPCQFRFLTNHCQARATNPRKQPEKTRVRIRGVFGRVEKRFPGPEKFTRKEPRKVFGPEKFSGLLRNARQVIFDWFVLSMRMQVILDSSFAHPGSAPIWGGKKGEFRDWTTVYSVRTPKQNM